MCPPKIQMFETWEKSDFKSKFVRLQICDSLKSCCPYISLLNDCAPFEKAEQLLIAECCRRQSEDQTCPQCQLTVWTYEAMKLSKLPLQALIYKVLKHSLHLTAHSFKSSAKAKKSTNYPQIEGAPMTWIVDHSANDGLINGPLVKMCSEMLVTEANKMFTANKKSYRILKWLVHTVYAEQ